MVEDVLARAMAPPATVADTRLPVMAAEDIQQHLAVMVEAGEAHRTAVEVDHHTAVVADPRTVVDLHTVADMGGNTTLDSWPA